MKLVLYILLLFYSKSLLALTIDDSVKSTIENNPKVKNSKSEESSDDIKSEIEEKEESEDTKKED